MTEHQFSKKLVAGLRRCNAIVLNIHGEEKQASGWPDLYIAHSFYNGFVELKGERTELKSLQAAIIRKLKERGTYACVVRYPNLIQNEEGVRIMRLESMEPLELLKALGEIKKRFDDDYLRKIIAAAR